MKQVEIIAALRILGVEVAEDAKYNALQKTLADLGTACKGNYVGKMDDDMLADDPLCQGCDLLAKCIEYNAAQAAAAVATPKTSGTRGASRGSDSKVFIANMIGAGAFTRKEIIESYLDHFPGQVKSTVGTYLSDSKNPKYNVFPFKVVVNNGIFSFDFSKENKKPYVKNTDWWANVIRPTDLQPAA